LKALTNLDSTQTECAFNPACTSHLEILPKAGSVSEATRPSEFNSHQSVRNTLVFISGVRVMFVCCGNLPLLFYPSTSKQHQSPVHSPSLVLPNV